MPEDVVRNTFFRGVPPYLILNSEDLKKWLFLFIFQITQLPESSFWKGLKRLRILYLHDNPVSQFSSINGLAACSSLTILTLFDTPLSLKFHYRHHVVNTIWSLQVLDHYIVSDNEIIEGAKFVGKFAAFSQPFQFDSYPKCLVSFVL